MTGRTKRARTDAVKSRAKASSRVAATKARVLPVRPEAELETTTIYAGADGMVGQTVKAILQSIRSGSLRPGDRLPSENALALQLGVSRIVIREANRSLAALGIVEISNGRSPRVSVPDDHVLGMLYEHVVHTRHVTIQQVLDVRRTMEARAVSLAAMRRSTEEAESMLDHAKAMRRAVANPEEVMVHDIALHAAIAEAARNPLLTAMIKAFAPVTRHTWSTGWKSRSDDAARIAMIDLHLKIATAIAEQDASAARTYMQQHFDETIHALVDAGVT